MQPYNFSGQINQGSCNAQTECSLVKSSNGQEHTELFQQVSRQLTVWFHTLAFSTATGKKHAHANKISFTAEFCLRRFRKSKGRRTVKKYPVEDRVKTSIQQPTKLFRQFFFIIASFPQTHHFQMSCIPHKFYLHILISIFQYSRKQRPPESGYNSMLSYSPFHCKAGFNTLITQDLF